MTDKMTPQQRHFCMSRIRSKDTKPEILARHWLWRHGYRYRLNVKSVPGKPDIVLRKYRTALFVNGCFWHGHEGCDIYSAPKSNTNYWINKINGNRERDLNNYKALYDSGWNIIVIWECQLKPSLIETTMQNVEHILSKNLLNLYQN